MKKVFTIIWFGSWRLLLGLVLYGKFLVVVDDSIYRPYEWGILNDRISGQVMIIAIIMVIFVINILSAWAKVMKTKKTMSYLIVIVGVFIIVFAIALGLAITIVNWPFWTGQLFLK
jgi:nitrate/nitrite transporter NarK